MTTRRTVLQAGAGLLVAGGLVGVGFVTLEKPSLIDGVKKACRRLSDHGWRPLLLAASGGELDIDAADLAGELARPLRAINRRVPGFGDFALAGARGIEPGQPAHSLLYHAFASPDVTVGHDGKDLGDFPSPDEIETVENYVYGVQPPTLDALRRQAGGRQLGIAVFALGYRGAADSVHGRHADLCFARTGIARLGTDAPFYNGRERAFDGYDSERPEAFRVVPQRFAAFVAMKAKGDADSFGPQDFLEGDKNLDFWVPLHKLFNGRECIAGHDLTLELTSHLRNEKLRRFHRYLETNGYQNEWTGDDLDQFPFTIRDGMIAALSDRKSFGTGMLEPSPHPLASPARYKDKPLGFTVDGNFTSQNQILYFTSLQILGGEPDTAPDYLEGAAQQTERPAPEYMNIRHPLDADGKVGDLNSDPNLAKTLRKGGYKALHYVDFAGDGWIEARCPAIEAVVSHRLPAFCLVAPPDFFPQISQRKMLDWWKTKVPEPLREGLWTIPPLALSQTRIAADISLAAGFDINDTGMTAIVSQPGTAAAVQQPNGRGFTAYSGLPDASPGLFDPGWDASQGIAFTDPAEPLQKFLQGYGLGSPFIEDVKLCAALGSYWPAVAPDSTRSFAPMKRAPGFDYPWPTVAPLTDQETGIKAMPDGKIAPWDGVRGPHLAQVGGRDMAIYADIERTDYIEISDKITGAYLARIDPAEYQARILAMASVYWALGIRAPDFLARHDAKDKGQAVIEMLLAKSGWALLSFVAVAGNDADLAVAQRATGAMLDGAHRYRFHLFQPGAQTTDPHDIRHVQVEVREQVTAFSDGSKVLLRRDDGEWQCDRSIPTS